MIRLAAKPFRIRMACISYCYYQPGLRPPDIGEAYRYGMVRDLI